MFGSKNAIIGGRVSLHARGGDDQVLIHSNAFGAGITLHGSSETDAPEINSATTARQTPVVRRFKLDSVDDANDLLFGSMQRLADVCLDDLLA